MFFLISCFFCLENRVFSMWEEILIFKEDRADMFILKGAYKEWLKSVLKNIKIRLIRVLGAMNFESYNLNDN